MIDETLTMIPGPTPVHPRILDALARPTVSHVSPVFVKAFRQALDDFKALGQSASAQPVVVSGGGTLSMEIALVNTVAPGESVLVISHGYFGDRYGDLASAFGIKADVLRSEWGRAVPPGEVSKRLGSGKYAAVTITHVDTSTGTVVPRRGLLRAPPRARRARDPGRRLRDGGRRRAVRPVGRRRPPHRGAEGDRGASGTRALPLLAPRARAPAVVPDRPRLLRGRPPLAPHHGGPRAATSRRRASTRSSRSARRSG